jgi:hypothetical protein
MLAVALSASALMLALALPIRATRRRERLLRAQERWAELMDRR